MKSLTLSAKQAQPPAHRLRYLLNTGAIIMALGLPIMSASAAQANPFGRLVLATCPGAVSSRLQVGIVGQVTITPADQTPLPVRVHQAPALSSDTAFMLTDGALFTVIGGPKCADNFSWWQIKAGLQIGWAAEGDSYGYFIGPQIVAAPTITATAAPTAGLTGGATAAPTIPPPVISAPISPDNAAQLKTVARLGRGWTRQTAWSPDGKTLAIAGSIGIWLYSTAALNTPPVC